MRRCLDVLMCFSWDASTGRCLDVLVFFIGRCVDVSLVFLGIIIQNLPKPNVEPELKAFRPDTDQDRGN